MYALSSGKYAEGALLKFNLFSRSNRIIYIEAKYSSFSKNSIANAETMFFFFFGNAKKIDIFFLLVFAIGASYSHPLYMSW